MIKHDQPDGTYNALLNDCRYLVELSRRYLDGELGIYLVTYERVYRNPSVASKVHLIRKRVDGHQPIAFRPIKPFNSAHDKYCLGHGGFRGWRGLHGTARTNAHAHSFFEKRINE